MGIVIIDLSIHNGTAKLNINNKQADAVDISVAIAELEIARLNLVTLLLKSSNVTHKSGGELGK